MNDHRVIIVRTDDRQASWTVDRVISHSQRVAAVGGEVDNIVLVVGIGGVERSFESGDVAIGYVKDSDLGKGAGQREEDDSEDEEKTAEPHTQFFTKRQQYLTR